MTTSDRHVEHVAMTLSFEAFWTWLQTHPNCVIRAGTADAVLHDDEDVHWHFAAEAPDTMVVQVLRGKKLVGEILLVPQDIAYVQGVAAEEDEYVFELISEGQSDRTVSYYFVLSHGYETQDRLTTGRAVH